MPIRKYTEWTPRVWNRGYSNMYNLKLIPINKSWSKYWNYYILRCKSKHSNKDKNVSFFFNLLLRVLWRGPRPFIQICLSRICCSLWTSRCLFSSHRLQTWHENTNIEDFISHWLVIPQCSHKETPSSCGPLYTMEGLRACRIDDFSL